MAGCGGGSNDTAQPPAPSLAAPANFTYDWNMRWTATPDATRYELYVDPDGPGPLPESKEPDATGNDWKGFRFNASPNNAQLFYGNFYDDNFNALDLATRINATYRLRACDAKGCGAFTAPIVKEYSYEFPSGRVPISNSQTSKDGLTLAIYQGDHYKKIYEVAVFTRGSNAHPWQQQALLSSGNASFGYPFVLSDDGNTLAVDGSASSEGDPTSDRVPTSIYQRSGITWTQQATLTPNTIPSACQQSCKAYVKGIAEIALSADGSVLARTINLCWDAEAASKCMGAVVIYARNGATWSQQALLETGDRSADIMALARDGKTLAVNQGAQYRDGSTPSFALVFTQQSNGTWNQQARIPVGIMYIVDIAAAAFSSMKLSDDGNTLGVMATNWAEDTSGRAVHDADLSCSPRNERSYMALFTRNGTTWQRQAAISRGYDSSLMWALARDGNALFYGGELFTRSNGTWACP